MCGICGKFKFDPNATIAPDLLKKMADTIIHRGPDDDGYYVKGQIGLGFRRLSIIDLYGGHQPLANEDDSIWIVFNGEIYNYQDLRTELIGKGHIFKTESDTEVIVHLFEEYGSDCVQKLQGMFAFAIWDSNQKSLFMARDRVGIKPLYYYMDREFLSFASEMKAILIDPAVTSEVDPSILDRFLTYYYVPGSPTLLRNFFKLPPGHWLRVRNGDVQIKSYWDLDFQPQDDGAPSSVLQEQLVELLDRTVQLHMISDVPVGFLLSGGVDSTAMLSLASKKTDKRISSYTIGFSHPDVVDERPFARLAADRCGSEHHEISITAKDFSSFLPEYVRYMEEPVCEPASVALYYVSKLARRDVKVLISGEGGDEAFAGYDNYRNLFWLEAIKRGLGPARNTAAHSAAFLGRVLNSRVLVKYAPLVTADLGQYYHSRTSSPFNYFNQIPSALYSADFACQVDKNHSTSVTRELLSTKKHYGPLEQMQYVDIRTWLPDDLLIKADRMTMANSIELRVPFLDHKVLEFASRLLRNEKVRGWGMKYILKQAMRDYVPREILDRRKVGFPNPSANWLRHELRDQVCDILLDSKSISRGYFRKKAVQELIESNCANGRYTGEIFSLIVLELWHRQFIDSQKNLYVAPGGRETLLPVAN